MFKIFKISNYIIAYLIITIILLVNAIAIHSVFAGIIIGLFYILYTSLILGTAIFKNNNLIANLFLGIILTLCLISIISSFVYLIYKFDNINLIITILLLSLLVIIYLKFEKYKALNIIHENFKNSLQLLIPKKEKGLVYILYLIFIIVNIYCWYIVINSQTTRALHSPWEVIPGYFFLLFGLDVLILIGIVYFSKNMFWSLLSVFVTLLLSNSVAIIVYKLGYGFDPIIHLVNEKNIFTTGLITPKSIIYIGQYTLIVSLAKIFQLNLNGLEIFEKFFLPILTSLFLPYIIYNTFCNIRLINKSSTKKLLLCSLFFLPIASFIVTLPSSLANFYLLIGIFWGFLILTNGGISILPLVILTFASFVTHALVGLFSIIFLIIISLFLIIKKQQLHLINKVIFILITVIILSAIIPVSFIFNSKTTSVLKVTTNSLSVIKLNEFFHEFYSKIKFTSNDFPGFYKLIYNYGLSSISLLLISFAVLLIFLALRKKYLPVFLVFGATFIIIQINYLIMKYLFTFSGLIGYERDDYTERVFYGSFIFFLPFAIYIIIFIISRIFSKFNYLIKLIIILIIVIFSTITLYLKYPVYDNYVRNHGLSASLAGLKAVQYVNNDATANGYHDYFVLTDQMVSVMALKEYGYYKYYKDQFYYPIPTGGKLYTYYLKLIYDDQKIIYVKEASDFMGPKIVYLIVVNYWDNYNEISKRIKKISDEYNIIKTDDNEVLIAKFII